MAPATGAEKKRHWSSFPPHEAFKTCTQKNIMAFLGKPYN